MDFGKGNPTSLNLSTSMELNRLLKLYEPPFLYLDNGDNISCFTGSLNEIRNVESLPQSLV